MCRSPSSHNLIKSRYPHFNFNKFQVRIVCQIINFQFLKITGAHLLIFSNYQVVKFTYFHMVRFSKPSSIPTLTFPSQLLNLPMLSNLRFQCSHIVRLSGSHVISNVVISFKLGKLAFIMGLWQGLGQLRNEVESMSPAGR